MCLKKKRKKRENKKRTRKKLISYFLTFLLFCRLYTLENFMATGQYLQDLIHSSIHTTHIHPLHSCYYLSPPSHHHEIQISPPLCDATGRTYIAIVRSCDATGGAYGAIGGRSEEENNQKTILKFSIVYNYAKQKKG